MHLRELCRHRVGLAVVMALSLFIAVSSVQKVSLFPPGLSPRAVEIGSSSTHVLVDTPRSTAVDARSTPLAISSLTARANLLGNVMSSPPVREYIGRRAHISPERIQTVAPLTPDVPRALAEPGHEKKTSDILRSTDQYRIEIQAQPTAPVLDIYTQAPSAEAAAQLANGAVDGLRDYLSALALTQKISPEDQFRIVQLGRARGSVVNGGVRMQLALLSFFVTFGVSAAAVLFVTRVRRGWKVAEAEEAFGPTAVAGEDALDLELWAEWPEPDHAERRAGPNGSGATVSPRP
jgi:hypothetical protein